MLLANRFSLSVVHCRIFMEFIFVYLFDPKKIIYIEEDNLKFFLFFFVFHFSFQQRIILRVILFFIKNHFYNVFFFLKNRTGAVECARMPPGPSIQFQVWKK